MVTEKMVENHRKITLELKELGLEFPSHQDFAEVDKKPKMLLGGKMDFEKFENYFKKNGDESLVKSSKLYVDFYNVLRLQEGEDFAGFSVHYGENNQGISQSTNWPMDFREKREGKWIGNLTKGIEVLGYEKELEEIKLKSIFSVEEASESMAVLVEQIEKDLEEKLMVIGMEVKNRIKEILDKNYSKL